MLNALAALANEMMNDGDDYLEGYGQRLMRIVEDERLRRSRETSAAIVRLQGDLRASISQPVTVSHEVSPGGFAVIPPQGRPIKITALPGGRCRIEEDPDGPGPGYAKIIGGERS